MLHLIFIGKQDSRGDQCETFESNLYFKKYIRSKCSNTSISQSSTIQLATCCSSISEILSETMQICFFVDCHTRTKIKILIHLIFISKKDSKVLPLNLTNQPIVWQPHKFSTPKQNISSNFKHSAMVYCCCCVSNKLHCPNFLSIYIICIFGPQIEFKNASFLSN